MGRKRRGRPIDGVLLLDKPSGITSFKAVDRARRALDAAKAGHTGTLDPLATGLLQICFGRATRLVQFLTGLDKRYRATIRLGATTTTYDAEGEIVDEADPAAVAKITRDELDRALALQRGAIQQRPPVFSAIKVGGERLYAKARRGEVVEVPLRDVEIHALEVVRFDVGEVVLDVHCGKGTYVRSIAADLGAELGVGGHLTALRRTAIGASSVDDAVSLADFEADGVPEMLVGLAQATAHFPTHSTTSEECADLAQGRPIAAPPDALPLVRALDEAGGLLAILELDDTRYRVLRGFHQG